MFLAEYGDRLCRNVMFAFSYDNFKNMKSVQLALVADKRDSIFCGLLVDVFPYEWLYISAFKDRSKNFVGRN